MSTTKYKPPIKFYFKITKEDDFCEENKRRYLEDKVFKRYKIEFGWFRKSRIYTVLTPVNKL